MGRAGLVAFAVTLSLVAGCARLCEGTATELLLEGRALLAEDELDDAERLFWCVLDASQGGRGQVDGPYEEALTCLCLFEARKASIRPADSAQRPMPAVFLLLDASKDEGPPPISMDGYLRIADALFDAGDEVLSWEVARKCRRVWGRSPELDERLARKPQWMEELASPHFGLIRDQARVPEEE